jgi:hypothetical protein
MPIYLTLFWLLVPDVELEDVCAFAIVADIDNESRLSPITENKNIDRELLLLLPLFSGLFRAETSVELGNAATAVDILNMGMLC